MKFIIAIEPGAKKTAFGVAVPDLPGCFSSGDTVEEAFDNAREAIEAHCEVLAEEGKELPRPKPMSKWQRDRGYKGWTWGTVDVPVERFFGPAEKINKVMPEVGQASTKRPGTIERNVRACITPQDAVTSHA